MDKAGIEVPRLKARDGLAAINARYETWLNLPEAI